MSFNAKQLFKLGLILNACILSFPTFASFQQDSSQSIRDFEKAKELRYQNLDSSAILMQKAHENFLKEGDTLMAINALMEMPYLYGQEVNYAKSYDHLWRALFLASDLGDETLKASIYGSLGRLYSFFKREEEAFKYLKTSLEINKELLEKKVVGKGSVAQSYYLICATYRELGEPELGKVYLDSCFLNYDATSDEISMPYLQFEKAFVLSKEQKNQEALEILEDIESWFLENRPSYLVLVYTYWGDVYEGISNYTESEKYYQKALAVSEKYKSHLDFSPLVYERLADLYLDRGNYKNALANLQMAKDLDAQFFDSRSERNRPLLEIKDEFRVETERREKLIQKQRLEQLEQEEKISMLQRVILLGTLVFLLIIGAVYIRHVRSKHRAEKQFLERSKALEMQKAQELLELKNKELAASALQLVEKDEFLKEIKSKLRGENGNVKTSEINQVLRSISISNSNNWEEFKLRFTAVNEKFYKKVTSQYPNLSQADQKICALIKLNFSSKEMARLLGISVESVHTTRYRLRKKMGLKRQVNLEDFIANL
ncbi:MAG: tetratricopeptide repeat protein [Flavobacteriaceae bacterium]